METDRFEWLNQRNEAAIDAERVIVDAHHHLWDRGGSTYLAADLVSDTGATHNVTQTVFVECRSKWHGPSGVELAPVGETKFVVDEATKMSELGGAELAAIVGHADLTLGTRVSEVLSEHVAAGAGLFRGIRHATAWDRDPAIHDAHTGSTSEMMSSAPFHDGAKVLASMGLSFDAWLFHPQIGELVALARAVPELTIVLDHLGAPLKIGGYTTQADQVDQRWKQAMVQAAACPNLNLKLGGLGMDNCFGTGWTELELPPSSEEVAAYWSDKVRWCIDTFGPSRCLFESNFPVDRQSVPYPVLWNSFQIMAAPYSDHEQDLLFSGTAKRVYQIAESGDH